MDSQSYEDGKAGLPTGSDTDITSYRAGQAARGTELFNESTSQQSDAKKGFDWSFMPKSNVDGVGFTILLMSPFMFIPYPVLGVSLYAAVLIPGALYRFLHFPIAVAGILLVVLVVTSFFWGMALEKMASQVKVYRIARMVWRPEAAVFTAIVLLITSNGFHRSLSQGVNSASGGQFLTGILAALLAHWLLNKADRLYFPAADVVEAELKARKPSEILTEISGPLTQVRQGEKGRWNFRIGNQTVFMEAEPSANEGEFVRAIGLPENEFRVLAMRGPNRSQNCWMETPKYPWILAIVGCLIVMVTIKPIVGIIAFYVPWRMHREWLRKRKAGWGSWNMLLEAEETAV